MQHFICGAQCKWDGDGVWGGRGWERTLWAGSGGHCCSMWNQAGGTPAQGLNRQDLEKGRCRVGCEKRIITEMTLMTTAYFHEHSAHGRHYCQFLTNIHWILETAPWRRQSEQPRFINEWAGRQSREAHRPGTGTGKDLSLEFWSKQPVAFTGKNCKREGCIWKGSKDLVGTDETSGSRKTFESTSPSP